MFLKALRSLSTPHVPELENVSSTTALNVLVSRVVLCVVELILLEQISGIR